MKLQVNRDSKELEIEATLKGRPEGRTSQRFENMNKMSGEMSERRGGFPSVLQHCIPLKPEECGGPLVDLDGTCLGINVSRAGRIKTYAIPASDLQDLMGELNPADFAPKAVKVDAAEILELKGLVDDLETDLSKLRSRLESLEAATR